MQQINRHYRQAPLPGESSFDKHGAIFFWHHVSSCYFTETYDQDSHLIPGSFAQRPYRVVLFEAVDWCICFTRKIKHGGDSERSRPQGPKNVHNFLMTVRPLSWACGHGTEMLLILKKLFLTRLFPDIFRYDSPKKCTTNLYAVNLWLKPVSATWATTTHPVYPINERPRAKQRWIAFWELVVRRVSISISGWFQETRNGEPMLVYCCANVCDVGPTIN